MVYTIIFYALLSLDQFNHNIIYLFWCLCEGVWLVLRVYSIIYSDVFARECDWYWEFILLFILMSLPGSVTGTESLFYYLFWCHCQGVWLVLRVYSIIYFDVIARECDWYWEFILLFILMSLPGSVRVYYNYSDVIARDCGSLLYYSDVFARECDWYWEFFLLILISLPGSVTGTESLFYYLSWCHCQGVWLVLRVYSIIYPDVIARECDWYWEFILLFILMSLPGSVTGTESLFYYLSWCHCQGEWLVLRVYSIIYPDVIARECDWYWEFILLFILMSLPGSVTGTESLFYYLSWCHCQGVWLVLRVYSIIYSDVIARECDWYWECILLFILCHCQGVWLVLRVYSIIYSDVIVRECDWYWKFILLFILMSLSGSVRVYYIYSDGFARECESLL